MNSSITISVTNPNIRLDVSQELIRLLRKTIDEKFLSNQKDEKELELYFNIDNDIESIDIIKQTNTKEQYITYTIVFPYHKIHNNNNINTVVFSEFFFDALKVILTELKINTNKISETTTEIISQIKNNPKYNFILGDKELQWRKIIEETRNTFKNKV